MNLQTYNLYRLANGLRLVCAPMPAVRSVAISAYVGVGARHESPANAGMAHFIEHMLFKGSANWPTALDIATEIEGHGGYLNASTSRENTVYWLKVGAHHWRRGVLLLADMLQHPLLREEDIAKERQVIIDEIRMYHDVPEDWVSLLCSAAMWQDNPLGRDIAGTIESVQAFDRAQIQSFHARAYRPEATVVVVAGAIESPDVYEAVNKAFGAWQARGSAFPLIPAPPQGPFARCPIEPRPTEQAHLQMAGPGLARHDEQRFALELLDIIVGEGMISRLWQRLREEMGVAYNIGSYRNFYSDTGVVGIYGGCDVDRLFETLDATMAVWDELQNQPVPDFELRRAKDYLRGRLELSSEDSSAVASWWGRQFAANLEPLSLDQVLQRIEAVTAGELRHLARHVWQAPRLTLAYVGPLDNPQRLQDWWHTLHQRT